MTGYPVKMTPVEAALLALTLCVPMSALAQEAAQPDAALLEFLADWNETDGDWLEAELTNELDAAVIDAAQAAPRAEKAHE